MNKRDFDYELIRITQRDTNTTNLWLKAEGISPNCFPTTDIKVLRAQQTAHNCLTHHAAFLTAAELDILEKFLNASKNKKARERLSDKRAYQVLNIGNRVKRQLFKQYRQLSVRSKANKRGT